MNKCPICQSEIDMITFYSRYSNRHSIVPSNQGIRCRNCRNLLGISQWRIYIFQIGMFALLPVVALLSHSLSLHGAVFPILLISLTSIWIWAQFKIIPQLAKLIINNSQNTSLLNDDWYFKGRTKEDIEEDEFMVEIYARQKGLMPSPVLDDWVCKKCGNENPKELEICWSCESPYLS